MLYHTVLANIHMSIDGHDLDDEDMTSQQITELAGIHVETLLRLYYLRHGFSTTDLFLLAPLSHLGFSTLKKLSSRQYGSDLIGVRSSLALAVKGLHEQGQIQYLARTTCRLLQKHIGAEESSVMGQLPDLVEDAESLEMLKVHDAQCRWVPAALKLTEDPDAERLGNLLKQYRSMNLDTDSDQTSTSGG